MILNEFQTPFEELFLDVNEDVKQEILDYVYGVPFIQNLISDKRKRAFECERDESGKIKIDLENPHILEDMDYFREMAIHYEKHGCYTFLKPNPNPKSEYGKLIIREVERCYEGMVRPSDGEWITGDYYYFLNYCPMLLSSRRGKGNAANRIMSFPSVWEGHYLKFHYINMARNAGMHGAELASRSKGKSFCAAALLAKRFNLGESKDVREKVVSYITASDKKYLVGGDQTLDKFVYDIDFFANNMGLPYLRLVDSLMNMQWVMGYKDMDTNTRKGTQNSVIGVSSKDDPSKLRGTRGVLYILEEWGSFPKLLDLYNNLRPSVEEGMGEERMTFGMIFAQGTSGDNANDFGSAQTIMYAPEGYNMYPINNVYDKKGEGAKKFIFFFPAYLNLAGCYNENGVSDVTNAIKQIIIDRNNIKKNTNDLNSITKRIAELPITPQEAVLRTKGNIFPTTDLMQRIIQLDNNPHAYDENYTGWLEFNGSGEVEFVLSGQQPIRIYPLDDNKNEGVIEIYQMPEKDRNGKVFQNRYCIGHDPVDDDVANDSLSLTSTFVFDLWTDKIVAEWTGRKMFADECYEVVRRLCIFYNAKCLYEAHPYDQKVITPSGVKLWKDIKIGDELFSIDGKTTKVIDIPIDGIDDIYELTLHDGRKVQASGNHIWNVFYYLKKDRAINLTTNELIKKGLKSKFGQTKYFLPEACGVNYKKQNVPIDPYTMGLLIAEGAFTKIHKKGNFKQSNKRRKFVQFSSSLEDAEFYKKVIPYEIKYIGSKGYTWHLYKEEIRNDLEDLGLVEKNSQNKFIPDVYLYNDYTTRLELLKGLMDGDGCAVKNGASVFITTSKQLAEDVLLLCRSLGIKANYNKGMESRKIVQNGMEINCHKSYRIAIHSYIPIFKLPRKNEKQYIYKKYSKGSKARGFIEKNAIIDIKYVGKKKCKCVTVDRKDGLYLIGDYVVTHNCNKKGMFSYFSRMNSLHYLSDTPEYLRDKQLIKDTGYGNKSKGVTATLPINNFANERIRDWLLKPVPMKKDEEEVNMPTLYTIKSRALLEELRSFNPVGNFDRVRALGMVMLYRESQIILYNGDVSKAGNENSKDLSKDDFFNRNYHRQITNKFLNERRQESKVFKNFFENYVHP